MYGYENFFTCFVSRARNDEFEYCKSPVKDDMRWWWLKTEHTAALSAPTGEHISEDHLTCKQADTVESKNNTLLVNEEEGAGILWIYSASSSVSDPASAAAKSDESDGGPSVNNGNAANTEDGGITSAGTDDGTTAAGFDDGTVSAGTGDGTTSTGTNEGATSAGTDDGATPAGADDGAISAGTDDGATSAATYDGTTPPGADDGTTVDRTDDGATYAGISEGTTYAATDDGTISAGTDYGATSSVTDDGTTSAVTDDGSTLAGTDDGTDRGTTSAASHDGTTLDGTDDVDETDICIGDNDSRFKSALRFHNENNTDQSEEQAWEPVLYLAEDDVHMYINIDESASVRDADQEATSPRASFDLTDLIWGNAAIQLVEYNVSIRSSSTAGGKSLKDEDPFWLTRDIDWSTWCDMCPSLSSDTSAWSSSSSCSLLSDLGQPVASSSSLSLLDSDDWCQQPKYVTTADPECVREILDLDGELPEPSVIEHILCETSF